MSLKIEQSFSSQNRSEPAGSMSIGPHHQMGGKQKYNSIDIAYDESNFELNQKNTRTNTNQQDLIKLNRIAGIKPQPMVIGPSINMLKQELSQKGLNKSSTKSKSSKKNLLVGGNNPYLLELNKMGTMGNVDQSKKRKKSESLDFNTVSYHQKQLPQNKPQNN
jgi:hypothetical protein